MKFNKDEERIIERILSGELSFSSKDIVDLETGKSTEEKEGLIIKLADEMKKAVEANNEIRKEVQEKIVNVEKDTYNKIELSMIEEDIRDFNKSLNDSEKSYNKNVIRGIISTFAFGIALPLVASLFTSSTLILLTILLTGAGLGIVPCVLIERKLLKNKKNLQEEIKKLEQERFELLGYKKNEMFESTVERTKNITKQIYASKDITITEEDMKNVF